MALIRRTGTNGDDTLYGRNIGSNFSEWFLGRDGDDTIYAGRGDDRVNGERGNDSLFGHEDNDTMYGGRGNDHVDGGPGSNRVSGGPGDDVLVAGDGTGQPIQGFVPDEDTFLFQNLLLGGDGRDVLHGSPADEEMSSARLAPILFS